MTTPDFSDLLNAVKPKVRTDRYKILAAMYCLGPGRQPVTAKQVADLLRLRFSGAAPPNVNASLRSYAAYVDPLSGKPLRWALTAKGMDHLRRASGLALEAENDEIAFDVDVGVVCALEHPEFAAVCDAVGGAASWKEIGTARYTHVYRESVLKTERGTNLRLVGTTATSMGLTAAAIATTQLVMQFRPRMVVMVGIAAGTREGNKEFGDVLVADPSVDYNSGKVVQDKGIRDFQPDPYPIGLNPRLRSVLHKYRGDHPIFTQIRADWKGATPSRPNRLHVGAVGAADQVIDDPSRVLEIRRHWRKLIGVEMETYGVYRACDESPEPKPRAISFKSVCDFAAEKSDAWQAYAAFVAAQFAFRFIQAEWESLWAERPEKKA